MHRSPQNTYGRSECETTRLLAEYERLRKRMHLLWSVPVRDMSAVFEVMTQLGETREAYETVSAQRPPCQRRPLPEDGSSERRDYR